MSNEKYPVMKDVVSTGKTADSRRSTSFVPPTKTSNADLTSLMEKTFDDALRLRKLKGGEYAGDDDALANFRRNAEAVGLNMETVWRIYAAKHWDAVSQYVKDLNSGVERPRLESIEGRIDDLIVYLCLFKAIIRERVEFIAREAGSK